MRRNCPSSLHPRLPDLCYLDDAARLPGEAQQVQARLYHNALVISLGDDASDARGGGQTLGDLAEDNRYKVNAANNGLIGGFGD